jgi:hypothetical protein
MPKPITNVALHTRLGATKRGFRTTDKNLLASLAARKHAVTPRVLQLGSQVITTRFTKVNTKAKKHHLVISNFGVVVREVHVKS